MKSNGITWIIIGLMVSIKLLLISTNEIVAIPYDSIQYIRHAANSVLEIGPAPGYPLWLAISRISGVPQRISIELLFLFSCLVLSNTVLKIFGRIAAVAVFSAVFASPATFFIFDSALSDGFYASLGLIALAFSFEVIFFTSLRLLFIKCTVLGVFFGVMAITRNEDPLLYMWGSLVVAALWFQRRGRLRVGLTRWQVAAAAAVVLSAGAIVVQSLDTLHYFSSGVFARSVPTLPGHTRLLDNLTKIETGEENIRFVPISAMAREMAYNASPSLKRFQSSIEDRDGPYQVASRANGIPDGQIGAGWAWHVFNHAILESLRTNDASVWEDQYKLINEELEQGFKNGNLKKRFVWHAFLTAPLAQIFRRAPASVWTVLKKTMLAHEFTEDLGHEPSLFDTVALRRTALVTGGYTYALQGWAFVDASGRKIQSIEVRTEDGDNLGGVIRMDRPDVEKIYENIKGWRPNVVGFRVEAAGRSKRILTVSYVLDDGSRINNPLGPMAPGVSTLMGAGEAKIIQGFDYSKLDHQVRSNWQFRAQYAIVEMMKTDNLFLICLIFGSVAVFIFGVGLLGSKLETRNVLSGCLFMGLLIFFRVLFYGLLESEAWVVEIRYMLPANLIAWALFGLVLSQLILSIYRKFLTEDIGLLQ
jgi:hypothetical protein